MRQGSIVGTSPRDVGRGVGAPVRRARRVLVGLLVVVVALTVAATPSTAVEQPCQWGVARSQAAGAPTDVRIKMPSSEYSRMRSNCVLYQYVDLWEARQTCSDNMCNGIVALQYALKRCYGRDIAVDGIFGPATKAALQYAQGKAGVTVDGVYGIKTAASLKFPGQKKDAGGTWRWVGDGRSTGCYKSGAFN